jgi:NTP pyrophosphatase (non-canonical NTP hydrolase)
MTDRVDKDSLQLNQPRRTPSHPTKSHIVKTKVDGKEKIIRFGEQGASTAGKPKEGESDRMKAKRASFKSRHAKNIAKGPSSPAYWANKVKWADGGFVKTNYAEGDSVRTQPQNAALGAIADFLKQTYSPRRTQQLQGTMEFLGVPALARTTERLSYGQPITNINKANVPMLPDDTAEAAMLVGPMAGPLGKMAKRVGTNLVQTAPYVARDIVESATSPLKSYAVKPKGGNWQPAGGRRDSVTMSVSPLKRNPEVISGDLINRAAGEDLWSKMVDENVYHYPASWLQENRPDVLNKLMGEDRAALNKWLDNKLEKYIRNDMGTPDDPVRLAHEEGYSHIPGNAAEELGAWLPDDTIKMRREAGYPEEGFAVKKHADAGYPEDMEANTRKAELWETLADMEITSKPAGVYQEKLHVAKNFPSIVGEDKATINLMAANPWLGKLDRRTPIYKIDRPMDLNENLGFGHMADEIQNMLDPESGLPAALRLTPQQLDKVTMKQMVEKVDAVNKWRSEEASKAELGDMMGNLTATARLEVPDAQLSFVKEPGMKWIDIPATTDESAMKLCTTIGRQAGWCTQGEGLAKRYGSGDNSLTTLIDAEGRPHAQAMLGKPNQSSYDAWFNKYKDTPEVDEFLNWEGQPKVTGSLDKRYQAWAKETGRPIEQVPQDIIELKPVENAFNSERAREYTKRDPDYKNKITDSVLDFLKSGSWGDVKDLHHYDIIDAKNPSAIRKFINDNYGGDFGMVDSNTIQKDFMKNYNGERFIKAEQFSDLVSDYIPKADGYAEGGSVKRAGEGLPDPTFSNLRIYADTVSQEMFPSERDRIKRDAARHMLASAIAAQKTNPTIAGLLGKAYEFKEAPFRTAGHWMGLSEPRSDYTTDVHNNELGIQLNKDTRSLQELLDSVEREAKRGTPETQKGRASLKPDVVKFTRYAEGGSVSYDQTRVDEIMNSINTPRGYAEGGSVSAYDPSRVDAIVNQFM